MQDFTDTPVGLKFFDRLVEIGPLVAQRLGEGVTVERQTLFSDEFGEFPGLHVSAVRSAEARYAHSLELFVCWRPETMEAFVNASNRTQSEILSGLPAVLIELMSSAAGERPIDLPGRSQDSTEIEWLHLARFAN